jgi:rhodanese-related sulfurtransferase
MNPRRVLAGAALILGAVAVLMREPAVERSSTAGILPAPGTERRLDAGAAPLITQLADEVIREQDHVTAIELAAWIKEHKQGLRVLDVRSAGEFETYHVPRAEHMPLESLVRARFQPGETLVLYSQGGAHAAQGWVFLRSLGHSKVYFLSGGLDEWVEDVMNPVVDDSPEAERIAALSRYFGGVPRRGDPKSAPVKASVTQLRRRGC